MNKIDSEKKAIKALRAAYAFKINTPEAYRQVAKMSKNNLSEEEKSLYARQFCGASLNYKVDTLAFDKIFDIIKFSQKVDDIKTKVFDDFVKSR